MKPTPQFNLDRTLSISHDPLTDLVGAYNLHAHSSTNSTNFLAYSLVVGSIVGFEAYSDALVERELKVIAITSNTLTLNLPSSQTTIGSLTYVGLTGDTQTIYNLEITADSNEVRFNQSVDRLGFADTQNLDRILTRVSTMTHHLKSITQSPQVIGSTIVYLVDVSRTGAFIIRTEVGNDLNTVSNPTLNLQRGSTYVFKLSSTARIVGFKLSHSNLGTNATAAIDKLFETNLTVDWITGTISLYLPYNTPNVLYYHSHSSDYIRGQILITGGEPALFPEIAVALNATVPTIPTVAPDRIAVVLLSSISRYYIVNWRVAMVADNPKQPASAYGQLLAVIDGGIPFALSKLIKLTTVDSIVNISDLALQRLSTNVRVYCAVYSLTANVELTQSISQNFKLSAVVKFPPYDILGTKAGKTLTTTHRQPIGI